MTIHFDNTIHITPVPDGVTKQEFNQEVGRLDNRIDVIEASSDVTDVVGTYQDLEDYDTSTLTDNDIIKVLEDSTHDDAISYYRWSTTSESFSFVGSIGPYTDTDLSNLSSTGNARLHALKGYEDAGELLTDAEGLADVTSYANSSVTGIDTIKADNYTITGSPTITNDGIASGFDDSNYISTSGKYTLNVSNKPWEIVFRVTTGTNTTGYAQALLGGEADKRGVFLQLATNGVVALYLNSNGSTDYIVNNVRVMSNGFSKNILFRIKFTGTQYYAEYSLDGGATFQSEMTPIESTTPIYSGGFLYLGRNGQSDRYFAGSIDLNSFKVYVDGDLVYQPCLKIPYTQSKTGSKIVDSSYRYRVSDMYEQFGYAPYYTLSASNFTLPQGEIYGMIERKANSSDIVPIITIDQASYDALVSGGIVDTNTLYIIVSSSS